MGAWGCSFDVGGSAVVGTTMLGQTAGMVGPVAGTELIGELCAGGGCRAWRGVEAVPPPVGPATAVSAATRESRQRTQGNEPNGHRTECPPWRTILRVREGLRMRWMTHPCGGCPPAPAAGQLPLFTRTPPQAKGEFSRMVEGGATDPQAGGGSVMGKAVEFPRTCAPFRQHTQGEGAHVRGNSNALLQSALPPQVKARYRL